MRNKWLITVAMGMIAGSLVASTGALAAEPMQLARMISPAAKSSATDRSAPADRTNTQPQAPTTIGQETLRHLMATIAPDDAVATHQPVAANKPVQPAKAKSIKHGKAKKKQMHRKAHSAHAHALQTAASSNPALAPAKLKPCHRKAASTLPAFLLESAHASGHAGQAPWQRRALRFGPK